MRFICTCNMGRNVNAQGRARLLAVNTSVERALVLSFSRPEDGGRGE